MILLFQIESLLNYYIDDSEPVVRGNGTLLQFVSDKLKGDREAVLAALKQNVSALRSVPEIHKSDKAIVLELAEKGENALSWASEALRKDNEVVFATVKAHPSSILPRRHLMEKKRSCWPLLRKMERFYDSQPMS